MRAARHKIIDTILIKPFLALVKRFQYHMIPSVPTIHTLLQNKAVVESARYASLHMQDALDFKRVEDLWDFVITQRGEVGLLAEFGVYKGKSINHFAEALAQAANELIYGFDSFEGLKENWRGHTLKKGAFSLEGKLPAVRPNVRLIKGWFDKTIPPFLNEHNESFSFIHIDSDTYDAAKTILQLIRPRIVPGTIVLFDEYFCYRGWRQGEWKAWKEFREEFKIKYHYLAFSNRQVALQVVAE